MFAFDIDDELEILIEVTRKLAAEKLLPTLREAEASYIRTVLERVGGNKTEAARVLGIDRKTLRSKLKP